MAHADYGQAGLRRDWLEAKGSQRRGELVGTDFPLIRRVGCWFGESDGASLIRPTIRSRWLQYFEGRSKRGSFAARRMTGRLGLVPGLVANGVVGTKEAWIASQGLAMTGAVG